MEKVKERIDILTNLLKSISTVGVGTRDKINTAVANNQESNIPLKQTFKRSLVDTISVPIIIRMTYNDGTVEDFDVYAKLLGKEVFFDENVVTGNTLIIGLTQT